MLKIGIVMGSETDRPVAEKAFETLNEFDVPCEIKVISAHRNPQRVRAYARSAADNGFGAIIAIAGLAAHLPGVIASMTLLPVIGVPAAGSPLSGVDALYSIVQMPAGVPVACVGIGNGKNAALLALQILSLAEPALVDKMQSYRARFGDDADG